MMTSDLIYDVANLKAINAGLVRQLALAVEHIEGVAVDNADRRARDRALLWCNKVRVVLAKTEHAAALD